jgi:hypothetical protein
VTLECNGFGPMDMRLSFDANHYCCYVAILVAIIIGQYKPVCHNPRYNRR